jgi:hypothetical protein
MNSQISTERPICHLVRDTKSEFATEQERETGSYYIFLDKYLFREIIDDRLRGHSSGSGSWKLTRRADDKLEDLM